MTGRFVPLLPPPDGLSAVLGEGRRRRRRRTAVTSGAAATVVAAALALAVLAPGGGTDALEPLPPAVPDVEPTASPSAPTEPAPPTPTAAGSPQPVGPAASSTAAEPSPVPPQTSTAPTPAPRPAPDGYRTPALARTYAGPPQQARLCGAAYTNDSSTGRVAWCVGVTAERTAQGADLVVEVCRDGATAGSLTYATEHEVDLAVIEDGRTLWQWTVGRTPAEDAHELSADAGGCWSWRAPWTGVDQRGEELDAGTYVLRGRSLADQLAGTDPQDTTFTL